MMLSWERSSHYLASALQDLREKLLIRSLLISVPRPAVRNRSRSLANRA